MIQNLITDLVCIDCNANLMVDLLENRSFFDTARGTEPDSGGNTGFDCFARFENAFQAHRVANHICYTDDTTCKDC